MENTTNTTMNNEVKDEAQVQATQPAEVNQTPAPVPEEKKDGKVKGFIKSAIHSKPAKIVGGVLLFAGGVAAGIIGGNLASGHSDSNQDGAVVDSTATEVTEE